MTSPKSRRSFLKTVAAGAATTVLPPSARADRKDGFKETFIYKKAGNCEIKVDIQAASKKLAGPVVVWIHGGALIVGSRDGVDPKLRDLLVNEGYVFASIDYRLAPETKLPAILEDVVDAFQWIRKDLKEKLPVDVEKIAVLGGSAGGYLTLTTGYRVQPAPRALVSFWGYGDIAGEWYGKPDAFYRKQPLVSREEAYAAIGGPEISETKGKTSRSRFYLYCRQNGLWPKEVAGLDPIKEAKAFDPYCPVRNVSAKYPPTLLIHGTKDTDVPYELSVQMAEELRRKGVEHELITVAGAGHGLGDAKPETVAGIHANVVTFLKKKLR
jgi:acetyl esterase/lipase